MDKASFFVKNKALFGSYPTQKDIEEYEENGVIYFINLTENGEKGIEPYKTKYTYIHYPIKDMRIPTDWNSFAEFIIKVSNIIKNLAVEKGDKLFLSCKGGHGRSGIVVACLLCYIYDMLPSDAISNTTDYHSTRKTMRDKWRRLGSPQTRSQKHFVSKFFEPLYIYNNHKNYFSYEFSVESDFTVSVPNVGTFPTAISAYYAFKNLFNKTYVLSLQQCTDNENIKKIFDKEPTSEEWENNKEFYMYKILKYKFEQHSIIKKHLLNTGLRPIIFCSSDLYLGKTTDSCGRNILGKILMKIRKNMYLSRY